MQSNADFVDGYEFVNYQKLLNVDLLAKEKKILNCLKRVINLNVTLSETGKHWL